MQSPLPRSIIVFLVAAGCTDSTSRSQEHVIVDRDLDLNIVFADQVRVHRGDIKRKMALTLDTGSLYLSISLPSDGGTPWSPDADCPEPCVAPPYIGGRLVGPSTDVTLSDAELELARQLFSMESWSTYGDEGGLAEESDVVWEIIQSRSGATEALLITEETSHAANREMIGYIRSLFDSYLAADGGVGQP